MEQQSQATLCTLRSATHARTIATVDNIEAILANDEKVRVAGVDADGILRGKIMDKEKFLSTISSGFGMSSAIFAWDIHDVLFTTETKIATSEDGFADFVAHPDLSSFRRLPTEVNIPFFLLSFAVGGKPVFACPRSMIRQLCDKLAEAECKALAGVELEFMNFQTPSEDGYGSPHGRQNLSTFLEKNTPSALRPLTGGMFGYSTSRPIASKKYFHDIFGFNKRANCGLEGWHTESGPGVYEAALKVSPIDEMADKVSVFKLITKSLGLEHGVTPCFLAKPTQGLPGNSGHIHVSLTNLDGKNIFARSGPPDQTAAWPDIAQLSDVGRYFLAGILVALPDIMPLLAPSINSYKRLVENYWAPVDVSWGLEDRLASLRLIAPPVCKPAATRFEVRIPGADLHPHYALTAIVAAGWRGVMKKLDIPIPPAKIQRKDTKPELLPDSLLDATHRFKAPDSLAREIFGDDFVDFFAATREHELRVWREAVTDWEFRRYIEVA
ncbi:Type-1 glutamine synthetase 2 [Colletotrichum aenigma]|uniref:Type-1 glutamine synthetase 2 n=1 Tax=Colletotrichum aenigma TaxID=1215731 RepID=UPI001872C976|nr:Type-1 glutamine synthetase 2 [Colletotrichum aenigma]KAF5524987.1 Type-1 glutamine synthetase 2 [Colletotrichum aenigma]